VPTCPLWLDERIETVSPDIADIAAADPNCRTVMSISRDRPDDLDGDSGGSVNVGWCPPQPERDENGEGRKRAERGQKMAERTKRVRHFSCDIRMLGWLGNLDSNQD
jgi:hypothetical protein